MEKIWKIENEIKFKKFRKNVLKWNISYCIKNIWIADWKTEKKIPLNIFISEIINQKSEIGLAI